MFLSEQMFLMLAVALLYDSGMLLQDIFLFLGSNLNLDRGSYSSSTARLTLRAALLGGTYQGVLTRQLSSSSQLDLSVLF